MNFKDLFSLQAPDYARFRPHYPAALFSWLSGNAPERKLAVDVGAGSGQAAVALAADFDRVIAVDPSEAQLANASTLGGVEYRRGSAEATGLDAASADLLVAAQAFHWFKQEPFFTEARRVVRPDGLLAIWCYGLSTIAPEIDAAVYELYEEYLGPYWEPERKLVATGYRTVTFPFAEIAVPAFEMRLDWTIAHLVGYLSTWSPLGPYVKEHGKNPLELVYPRLAKAWGQVPERPVTWPIAVRAFRL